MRRGLVVETFMKKVAAYLLQKLQHRAARIEYGARVARCAVGGYLSVGRNSVLADCKVEGYVRVDHDSYFAESEIGYCSYVGPYSYIRRTRIGRFCSIGPYALAGVGTHPTSFVSTSPVFYASREQCGISFAARDLFRETSVIDIGHDVWIGARAFVRDGVHIGTGAVVGAGAVVVSDIDPYAVVVGVPARVLRYRFSKEDVEKLLRLAWWTWPKSDLQEASGLMAQSNVRELFRWAEMRKSEKEEHKPGVRD